MITRYSLRGVFVCVGEFLMLFVLMCQRMIASNRIMVFSFRFGETKQKRMQQQKHHQNKMY